MSGLALAASAPKAYWYLTRGTGAVALILLTLSVALGVANQRRVDPPEVPRFVLQGVHRSLALLAVVFTALHVVTTLLDGFAPIHLTDAFIPFLSPYRTLWLGSGTVAFDLLLAVVISSLVRRRLGQRGWRAIHWLSYGSWPIALIHGFGTGSDAKTGWMLLLSAICLLVVLGSVALRIGAGWPDHLRTRVAAILASAALPLALVVWLPSGPLGSNWAKRAGTPASLLVHAASGGTSGVGQAGTGNGHSTGSAAGSAFTVAATGTVTQSLAGSQTIVAIDMHLSGVRLTSLRIRLEGAALPGGGVQMNSSQVSLGAAGNPDQYSGQVTALNGSQILASVQQGGGGGYSIQANVQIDAAHGHVTGTVSARPFGH